MFSKSVFFFYVCFFCTAGWAQYSIEEVPHIGKYQLQINPVNSEVSLGLLGQSPNLTYQSIKAANPKSINDVLKVIQNQAPQLFDQAVVVHTSASMQPSDRDKKPRILLYGENLTLSFSLQQQQDKSIEFLQFDNSSMDYSMHEIVFPEQGGVEFVDAPKECASCHGQNPKPVWESYDFWPSAIGSQSGITRSKAEKEWMDWVTKSTHSEPLLKRINVDVLKESIDTFTAYLSQQNFLRATKNLERELKPQGKLYPFRYALLGLLSCTDKSFGTTVYDNIIFKDFIPKSIRDQWKISFDQVFYDVELSNKRVKDTLWEYYLRSFPGSVFPSDPLGGLTRLRTNEIVTGSQLGYIFSNLGLNLRSYNLSYREDSYIMSTPNVAEFDLQKTLVYFMPEVLKELTFDVAQISGAEYQFYEFDCDQLKTKSFAALKNRKVTTASEIVSALKPHKGLSPIGMCVSCHAGKAMPGTTQPPYIAFDDTFKLGEQLRTTDLMTKIKHRLVRNDIKKMPRGLPTLTKQQRQALMSTLRKIEKNSRP